MSWNGSDQATSPAGKGSAGNAAVHSSRPPKASRTKHGLLALLIVLALAGAALYFFTRPAPPPPAPTPAPQTNKVARVAPKPPIVSPKKVVEEPKEEIPFWEVDASQTNGFTSEMMHKWRDKHAPPPAYRFHSARKKSRWHIFDHKCENRIAALLCAEPGKARIGRIGTEGMTEDFLESLKHPIIPMAEDDEYTRNLKKQMIEVKISLKERLDNGEDIGKIIEDTEDELRKLAMFKRDLEKNLNELLKDETRTKEDIRDFETAANVLLESKGIAPLEFTDITEERLMNMKEEEQK